VEIINDRSVIPGISRKPSLSFKLENSDYKTDEKYNNKVKEVTFFTHKKIKVYKSADELSSTPRPPRKPRSWCYKLTQNHKTLLGIKPCVR